MLGFAPALLTAGLLLAPPVASPTAPSPAAPKAAKSADAWARVVATGADREAVVAALGAPPHSFPAVVDPTRPLLVVPTTIDPPEDGAPARAAVRVYMWPSDVDGIPWQVVMRDGKALWAVGPPAADERSLAAITKKYGAPVESTEGALQADMHSEWELLSYPAKGLSFVRRPGKPEIVARRLTAPTPAMVAPRER